MAKGIILMALGILGDLFVYFFDIIMGKPVNDISGPKSIAGFIICTIFIAVGCILVIKNRKK